MSKLRQLAEGVWILSFNIERVEPNVGIVCMPMQTVLIDSGNSPKHARRVLEALREIQAPPISYVIYTHHHWDHTFGASEFEAPVIAHESCPGLLLEMVEREKHENPSLEDGYIARAIEGWNNLRIVIPTITFSHKMKLRLDAVTVILEHVGGQHSEDSIVVRIKERGVMFLGDSFYPPPLRLRRPEDNFDFVMLESFLDDSFYVYVDAHNNPKDLSWHRRWIEANSCKRVV